MTQDKDRAAFEAWAKSKGHDVAYTYDTERSQHVWLNPMAADLWEAWQAAIAHTKTTAVVDEAQIELPPLPEYGEGRLSIGGPAYCGDALTVEAADERVRQAIAHDRQQREPIITDDMRSAVRFAPSSAHWSKVLIDLFGADAREGIDALEKRLRESQSQQHGDEPPISPNDDIVCKLWVTASDVDGIAYDGPSYERGYRDGQVVERERLIGQAPEWPDFARMEASLQRLKDRLVFENGLRKELEQKLREKPHEC